MCDLEKEEEKVMDADVADGVREDVNVMVGDEVFVEELVRVRDSEELRE